MGLYPCSLRGSPKDAGALSRGCLESTLREWFSQYQLHLPKTSKVGCAIGINESKRKSTYFHAFPIAALAVLKLQCEPVTASYKTEQRHKSE